MPRRSMSSEKPLGRSVVPEVSGGAGGTVVWSLMSDSFVDGRGGEAEVPASPAGHELDDLGHAGFTRPYLGGDPAEEEDGDAVGDGHDVVHVVADEHHAQALV